MSKRSDRKELERILHLYPRLERWHADPFCRRCKWRRNFDAVNSFVVFCSILLFLPLAVWIGAALTSGAYIIWSIPVLALSVFLSASFFDVSSAFQGICTRCRWRRQVLALRWYNSNLERELGVKDQLKELDKYWEHSF